MATQQKTISRDTVLLLRAQVAFLRVQLEAKDKEIAALREREQAQPLEQKGIK